MSAWRHQCGHLNDGKPELPTSCSGCRFEVKYSEEILAIYLLTSPEEILALKARIEELEEIVKVNDETWRMEGFDIIRPFKD